MTEYRQACKKLNIAAKIASLKKALQTTFSSDASLNSEAAILTEYVSLLERQQPIDVSFHMEHACKYDWDKFLEYLRRC